MADRENYYVGGESGVPAGGGGKVLEGKLSTVSVLSGQARPTALVVAGATLCGSYLHHSRH